MYLSVNKNLKDILTQKVVWNCRGNEILKLFLNAEYIHAFKLAKNSLRLNQ